MTSGLQRPPTTSQPKCVPSRLGLAGQFSALVPVPACRWLKDVQIPDPGAYSCSDGRIIYDPIAQADVCAKKWAGLWAAAEDLSFDTLALVGALREQAAEDAALLEPLGAEKLRTAAGRIRKRTALGCDQVSPADLRDMPEETWQDLAALLAECEAELLFPVQVLVHLMISLPKPGGGERMIALLALVLRGWSKARRQGLASWDARRAGFWDTAIAGSSALKAALWRALGDETAGWMHLCCGTLHVDIEKFFDTLDPRKLLVLLQSLDFPPFLLYMHTVVHWSARIVVAPMSVSQVIGVTRSVLAGSEASCSLARGYVRAMPGISAATRPAAQSAARPSPRTASAVRLRERVAWESCSASLKAAPHVHVQGGCGEGRLRR